MGKYKILAKGRGNKRYIKCIITYTVEGITKPDGTLRQHDIHLIYVGEGVNDNYFNKYRNKTLSKYAFIEGCEYPGIKTEEDRVEFLHELYLFQKGGSYNTIRLRE